MQKEVKQNAKENLRLFLQTKNSYGVSVSKLCDNCGTFFYYYYLSWTSSGRNSSC